MAGFDGRQLTSSDADAGNAYLQQLQRSGNPPPPGEAQASPGAQQYRSGYGQDVSHTFRPGSSTTTGQGSDFAPYLVPPGRGDATSPNTNGAATVTAPRFNPTPVGNQQISGAQHPTNLAEKQKLSDAITRTYDKWAPYPIDRLLLFGGIAGSTVSFAQEGLTGVSNYILRDRRAYEGAPTRTERWLSSMPLTDKMRTGAEGWVNQANAKVDDLKAKASEQVSALGERIRPAEGTALDKGLKQYSSSVPEGGWLKGWARAWHNNFTQEGAVSPQLQEMLKTYSPSEARQQLHLDHEAAVDAEAKWVQDHKGLQVTPEQRLEGFKISDRVSSLADDLTKLGATEEKILSRAGAVRVSTNTVGGFARGAGMVGVTMMADHYLDKALSLGDHDQGFGLSWRTAFAIPYAFALGGTPKKTLAYAAGATALAAGAEYGLHALGPGKSQSFTRVLAPTTLDAISIGAAAGLKTNNPMTKAAFVAGAWFEARSSNVSDGPSALWGLAGLGASIALAPNTEARALAGTAAVLEYVGGRYQNHHRADHPELGALNTTAFSSLKNDMSVRTSGSAMTALDNMVKLGGAGYDDKVLLWYWGDWTNKDKKFDSPLLGYRGGAILGDALAEARLARGTVEHPAAKTDKTKGPSQYTYIPGLEGLDLDIGSDAARYLLKAKSDSTSTIKLTQQIAATPGQKLMGTEVTAQEAEDFKKVDQRIDATHDRIYGQRHDVSAGVDALAAWYQGNYRDYGLLHARTVNSINLNYSNALAGKPVTAQFTAKLARDAVILESAAAKNFILQEDGASALLVLNGDPANNTGSRAPSGLDNMLKLAHQLDPNNKDLPELDRIQKVLRGQADDAYKKQKDKSYTNILGTK